MLNYRLMTIGDYEAAYDLWIKCGNGLNNKDDSYEGIEKYLNGYLIEHGIPGVAADKMQLDREQPWIL